MDSLSIFDPRFFFYIISQEIIASDFHGYRNRKTIWKFASFPLSHELVVTVTNNSDPLSATLCGLDGIFSTLTWPRNSRYSASKPYIHGPPLSLRKKYDIAPCIFSLVSNTLAIIHDACARVSSPRKFSIFTRSQSPNRIIYIVPFFKRASIISREN